MDDLLEHLRGEIAMDGDEGGCEYSSMDCVSESGDKLQGRSGDTLCLSVASVPRCPSHRLSLFLLQDSPNLITIYFAIPLFDSYSLLRLLLNTITPVF